MLLLAIAQAIKFENGNVTEYLGDRMLALFEVDSENKKEAIYAVHRAAKTVYKTLDILLM